MGRKLPKTRKHKKIKQVDPFYSGVRTNPWDKGAAKSNCRPTDPHDQEVPRKVMEIVEFKKLVAENKINPQGQLKKTNQEAEKIPWNAGRTPFNQKELESDKDFLKRLNEETDLAFEQAKLEKKFHVKITEDEDGRITVGKGTMDEDVMAIEAAKEKRKLRRQKFEEKRKTKNLARIEKKKDDFEHLQDKVKFGEVVTRPPKFSVAPRKGRVLSQAGSRNLLLKDVLNKEGKQVVKKSIFNSFQPLNVNRADRTIKRKCLTLSDRHKLETEKNRVVEAYRLLKATKRRYNQ